MKYAEYLEVKGHDVSDLLPNGSGKKTILGVHIQRVSETNLQYVNLGRWYMSVWDTILVIFM